MVNVNNRVSKSYVVGALMETKQLIDTLLLAVEESLANMHTCTIAKVTKVNTTTINCKPVTNRLVNGESIELPEFIEVPVLTLQGGSSYIHMPIAVGDYALLFFTERCFDGWYNGQDFKVPLEYRMHDYSDGIALVGVNPLSGALTIPDVIQRTGDTNQDGDKTHQGDVTHTGNYILTGNMTITGNLIVNGNITINSGDLTVDGISFKTHVHPINSGSSAPGPTGVAQ